MQVLVIGSIKGDPSQNVLLKPYGKLKPYLLCNRLLVLASNSLIFLHLFLAILALDLLLILYSLQNWAWIVVDLLLGMIGICFCIVDPGIDSSSDVCIQSQKFADFCGKCKNGSYEGKHCEICDVCVRDRGFHSMMLGKCFGKYWSMAYGAWCIVSLIQKIAQSMVMMV